VREWREGSGIRVADCKAGEFCAAAALGMATSNIIKSSVSGGKEGSTANLRRRSWDTGQATLGLPTGGQMV